MSRTALSLCAVVAMALTGPVARADKPSPIGYRMVWMHQRFLSGIDAESEVCTGDARAHEEEAKRVAATIDKSLLRIAPDRAKLPERDADHPDVVAAIAHMDALVVCREHIRASLAGELAEEEPGAGGGEGADVAEAGGDDDRDGDGDGDGEAAEEPLLTDDAEAAPATEAGFVASLSPSGRDALSTLVGFDVADAATLPANARALRRVHAAGEAVWALCTGKFAGLIMGGAADGERAADADPWEWCRAAAQRVERTRAMGTALVARGLAALEAAEATLSAAGEDAKAEVEAAVKRLAEVAADAKDELTEAKLAAESAVASAVVTLRDETAEIALIGDLVGLEATAEVDAVLEKARRVYGRFESVVDDVVSELAAKGERAVRKAADKISAEARKRLRKLAQKLEKRRKKKLGPR